MRAVVTPVAAALAFIGGCGGPVDDTGALGDAAGDAGPGDAGGADADRVDVVIPLRSAPCDEPELWPLELESITRPFDVHYTAPWQRDDAAQVQSILEHAWQVEVDELGFAPPLPDRGLCGADDDYDVFLWPAYSAAYVESIADEPDTTWDDWLTFMVVDPGGPYGGDALGVTVAHEFNHSCQASDDWWEPTPVFEMTATFIEDVVFDDNNYYQPLVRDFQRRPHWSLDRFDDYSTWYMYSSALYLHFLREVYFSGDASFVAQMWRGTRGAPNADEPDFVDGLESLLGAGGFADSVAEFARWRWFTGANHDGAHFSEGGEVAAVREQYDVDTSPGIYTVSPMVLGTQYVRIQGAGSILLSVASQDASVRWSIGLLPDDEELAMPAVIDVDGFVVIAVTALPTGNYEPESRTDTRYLLELQVAAAP